jgi:hypothetical protein
MSASTFMIMRKEAEEGDRPSCRRRIASCAIKVDIWREIARTDEATMARASIRTKESEGGFSTWVLRTRDLGREEEEGQQREAVARRGLEAVEAVETEAFREGEEETRAWAESREVDRGNASKTEIGTSSTEPLTVNPLARPLEPTLKRTRRSEGRCSCVGWNSVIKSYLVSLI